MKAFSKVSPSGPTHFEVLGLPRSSEISTADVRRAYRKSLLKYHPDKARRNLPISDDAKTRIDDVKEAFRVLSDSELREEYERNLALVRHKESGESQPLTGVEAISLDDMIYHEASQSMETSSENSDHENLDNSSRWTRSCRCGQEQGFEVYEEDLEEALEAKSNDVLVGCNGCSLWLRVGFEQVEND
jgi:diphthamide biosynthesis protein 4